MVTLCLLVLALLMYTSDLVLCLQCHISPTSVLSVVVISVQNRF